MRRSLLVLAIGLLMLAAPTPGQAAPAGCAAGSGPQLREHHFTQADLDQHPNLRCADLRDANLTGLSLTQVDLTGADLRQSRMSGAKLTQATLTGADVSGADLSGADLGQATLKAANFTGADLSHADLTQVEAGGAVFVDADLSEADLTQAELKGAHLDGANLKGTTFIQAVLDGVTVTGADAGIRWDLWIAIAAVALFLFLALRLLMVIRRSDLRGAALAKALGVGLLGRLIVVIGLHIFVAGLYGIVSSGSGRPFVALCTGPQCAVGVDLGIWSPFIGTGVTLAGLAVCALGRVRRVVRVPSVPVTYQPYLRRHALTGFLQRCGIVTS